MTMTFQISSLENHSNSKKGEKCGIHTYPPTFPSRTEMYFENCYLLINISWIDLQGDERHLSQHICSISQFCFCDKVCSIFCKVKRLHSAWFPSPVWVLKTCDLLTFFWFLVAFGQVSCYPWEQNKVCRIETEPCTWING